MKPDDESVAKNQQRHAMAQHAVQSGIGMLMNYDEKIQDPKHLRVGINFALRDLASITHLLVKKGIVSEGEVWSAMADGMEEEKEWTERLLTEHTGVKTTLA